MPDLKIDKSTPITEPVPTLNLMESRFKDVEEELAEQEAEINVIKGELNFQRETLKSLYNELSSLLKRCTWICVLFSVLFLIQSVILVLKLIGV